MTPPHHASSRGKVAVKGADAQEGHVKVVEEVLVLQAAVQQWGRRGSNVKHYNRQRWYRTT
jgi:hypothetical protein